MSDDQDDIQWNAIENVLGGQSVDGVGLGGALKKRPTRNDSTTPLFAKVCCVSIHLGYIESFNMRAICVFVCALREPPKVNESTKISLYSLLCILATDSAI